VIHNKGCYKMKDAILHMKLTKQLHNAIQSAAEKHNISMAAYVRAVLAHQVYGRNTHKIMGEEWLVTDGTGEHLLDI